MEMWGHAPTVEGEDAMRASETTGEETRATQAPSAPLVGTPCYEARLTRTERPVYANNQSYIRALIAAGATPLLIPPGLDDAALEAVCARLDGLLLTGGADLDPALYGEERLSICGEIEPERDALELAITRMALARDLPTFGICRGMQTLNVACGGALYQDITAQRPGAFEHAQTALGRSHRAHAISVAHDSRLGAILGAERVEVNSLHHQAVSRPGAGVRIVAQAEDGVAEAMELEGRRFALAVQYHPEELVETDPYSRRLFAAFVAACREG